MPWSSQRRPTPERNEGNSVAEKRAEITAKSRRDQVLEFLVDREAPTGINEVATSLGVHVNTVRWHLESLHAQGLVERVTGQHDRPGRPPQLFVAVPAMDPSGPRNYQLLADILAAGFSSTPESRQRAIDVGRAWGRTESQAPESSEMHLNGVQGAVNELMRVLADLDFAPELRENDSNDLPVIGLRHCPFLDLIDTRSDIICPVHLGLMRGVLESRDAEITVNHLEPLVQPDLCTVHLDAMEGT